MASKEGHGTLKRLGFPVGSLKRNKNKVGIYKTTFIWFIWTLFQCQDGK